MGIAEVTFLIFLVLKLVGTIDWSWWWVTSPLWIAFILYLILYFIIGVSAAFAVRGKR